MKYSSIILSGLPLSGKSTLAKKLAEDLKWKVHSIGDIFKERWKELYPNQEVPFEEYWKSISIEENKKIDQETRKLFENEHLVGDFRYSTNCQDLNVLLVLVTADISIRIERAIKSGRYKGKSKEEIEKILNEREKDETDVGKQLYGQVYDFKDPKNYRIKIDLGKLATEEAIKIIKSTITDHKAYESSNFSKPLVKIYFACSIAGGRDHAHLYPEIVNHLKNHGEVLTEIFSDNNIFELDSQIEDHVIFNRDMEWIGDSGILVAEASTPSLGVGFEIATALNQGKKVICLFKNQDDRMLSAMISGNKNIHIIRYSTIKEAKQKIDEAFNNKL